jgi:hypothetical protein
VSFTAFPANSSTAGGAVQQAKGPTTFSRIILLLGAGQLAVCKPDRHQQTALQDICCLLAAAWLLSAA